VLPGFFGVFGFDELFQAGQTDAPEAAVLVEPVVYGAERFGIELVDAVAAFAMLVHKVGATQQAKVLGDGGTGNREGSGDFSGGLAAPAQQVEDGAASRIGQGLEGGFGGICNRTVTHDA
jgi:hypothetical protein